MSSLPGVLGVPEREKAKHPGPSAKKQDKDQLTDNTRNMLGREEAVTSSNCIREDTLEALVFKMWTTRLLSEQKRPLFSQKCPQT